MGQILTLIKRPLYSIRLGYDSSPRILRKKKQNVKGKLGARGATLGKHLKDKNLIRVAILNHSLRCGISTMFQYCWWGTQEVHTPKQGWFACFSSAAERQNVFLSKVSVALDPRWQGCPPTVC